MNMDLKRKIAGFVLAAAVAVFLLSLGIFAASEKIGDVAAIGGVEGNGIPGTAGFPGGMIREGESILPGGSEPGGDAGVGTEVGDESGVPGTDLPGSVESDETPGTNIPDSDIGGAAPDKDGDGLTDAVDPDKDGDGIVNEADKDADGDGVNDASKTGGIIGIVIACAVVVAAIVLVITVIPKKPKT